MAEYIVGIDLGGTSAKLALFDRQLDEVGRWQVATNAKNGGQAIIPDLIASIQSELQEHKLASSDLIGIGMGTPGSIDRQAGNVQGAFNLGWAKAQDIRGAFQEVFPGVKVALENDANVAALGEHAKGAGKDYRHLLLVTLGTGIGGGLIVNDQLLVGAGNAGEIGHIQANPEGFLCTCGNRGCIETIASATGFRQTALARAKQEESPESSFKSFVQAHPDRIDAELIFEKARAKDAFAQAVVEECLTYLGRCLSQIANSVHPQCILLGGGVAQAGNYLIQGLKPAFEAGLYPGIKGSVEIKIASLGNDAGMIGAASLIQNDLKE